jgi:hypothetical protein
VLRDPPGKRATEALRLALGCFEEPLHAAVVLGREALAERSIR